MSTTVLRAAQLLPSFPHLLQAEITEVAIVFGSDLIRLFLHWSPKAVARRLAQINVGELGDFLAKFSTEP